MRLLIVRHAPAVTRERGRLADAERPLTKAGAKAFARTARALAEILPLPKPVLTSPLLRARRTAEIALAAWKSETPPVSAPALAQPALKPVFRLLVRHSNSKLLAIFGHEPGLSALLAHLLGNTSADPLGLKKGGAALVETDDPPRRGSGRLLWLASPRLMRALGRRR